MTAERREKVNGEKTGDEHDRKSWQDNARRLSQLLATEHHYSRRFDKDVSLDSDGGR